jgi:DNA topoisomerase III
MPPQKILCVAEKPSIAKAVAQHLGGGAVRTVRSMRLSEYRSLTVVEGGPWTYLCQEL